MNINNLEYKYCESFTKTGKTCGKHQTFLIEEKR